MAELLEAIDIDQIAVGLPNRIHEVTAGQVIKVRIRSRWSRTASPGAIVIWIGCCRGHA